MQRSHILRPMKVFAKTKKKFNINHKHRFLFFFPIFLFTENKRGMQPRTVAFNFTLQTYNVCARPDYIDAVRTTAVVCVPVIHRARASRRGSNGCESLWASTGESSPYVLKSIPDG